MSGFFFILQIRSWKTSFFPDPVLVLLVQRLSSTRREILFINTSGFACQTWEQIYPVFAAGGCVAAGASVAEADVPVVGRNLVAFKDPLNSATIKRQHRTTAERFCFIRINTENRSNCGKRAFRSVNKVALLL